MSEEKIKSLIARELLNFIIERRSRRLSVNTIDYYSRELGYFADFLKLRDVLSMEDLTPDAVRGYLVDLQTHRNAGGCHASWRAIKAFCSWFEKEEEDSGWKNPMRKIPAPKISTDPLPGISLDDFSRMVETCSSSEFLDLRDKSILLALLDTGLRRAELLAINLEDINMNTGEIRVRAGKGNKRRTVIIGLKTRRALSRYLRKRPDIRPADPLFVIRTGKRLEPKALVQVIKTRGRRAGLEKLPGTHDFRRAFALQFLRNGGDVFTLQRLMGHSSLTILRRYLAQDDGDLMDEHKDHSPVDNSDI
jgi:integrase/recombinase XerD